MIERTSWLAPVLLGVGLALGCTVGEARPERPTPPTDARPGPDEVVGVPGEPVGPEAEARAAELSARARSAYDVGEVGEALELGRQVLERYPSSRAAESAMWVAARSAFAQGHYEEARRLAESFAARQPAGSEAAREARALAELARDAQARPEPAVIGALVPRTGSQLLVQYGDWVLEGIRLAIREAEQRQGRSIELVVADDAAGGRTAAAVAELERRGVAAIIGPILPQQLPTAAGARTGSQLLLISPTVAETPSYWPNVYSVSGGDTRGAQELARYAVDTGLLDAAVLFANGPEYQRRADAFVAEFRARGGRVRTTVAYESGTTTFASHMQRILGAVTGGSPGEGAGSRPGSGSDARPFVLFVAAPERDVPQIAPQVSFYGLDAAGARVFGDSEWSSPAVRRQVPNRDLEGVVAVSALPPGRAEGLADPDFVAIYEQSYRRSLPNALPALGYDAAHLVLQALPNRAPAPATTTIRFQLLAAIPGATGTFAVRGGHLVRSPHLVVIRGGQLEAAPSPWDVEDVTVPADPDLVPGQGGRP